MFFFYNYISIYIYYIIYKYKYEIETAVKVYMQVGIPPLLFRNLYTSMLVLAMLLL